MKKKAAPMFEVGNISEKAVFVLPVGMPPPPPGFEDILNTKFGQSMTNAMDQGRRRGILMELVAQGKTDAEIREHFKANKQGEVDEPYLQTLRDLRRLGEPKKKSKKK